MADRRPAGPDGERARRKPRPTRRRATVMAADGGLYILPLGDRVILDLLARVDDGFAVFLRVDGELLVELPVLGSA
jgi:hypothetical protein